MTRRQIDLIVALVGVVILGTLLFHFAPTFGRLWMAWSLFTFAVINIANSVVMYVRKEDDSIGPWALVRMLAFAAALAGWSYLLFY